jgi:competence protein ComGB
LDLFPISNMLVGFRKNKPNFSLVAQGTFFVRLGEMLQRGFTMVESIDFLLLSIDQPPLNKALRVGFERLKNGDRLHDVLKEVGCHPTVCTLIYFAEQHGKMADVLKEAGQWLLKRNEEQQKLKRLLQYPILLCMFVGLLFVILRWFLYPQLEYLHGSFSYSTSSLNSFLSFLLYDGPVVVFIASLLILGLAVIFLPYWKTQTPLQKVEIYRRLPIVRIYFTLYHTHFFSRQLSFLLASGFSIMDIIRLFEKQPFKPFYKEMASYFHEQLMKGREFSTIVEDLPYFKKELSIIIRHGEWNGKLEYELDYYSRQCLEELERYIKQLIQWVQPVVFIFIGMVIIILYLSVMFPLYDMINNI